MIDSSPKIGDIRIFQSVRLVSSGAIESRDRAAIGSEVERGLRDFGPGNEHACFGRSPNFARDRTVRAQSPMLWSHELRDFLPPFDFFFAPGRISRKSEALANYLVDFMYEEQLI